MYLRIDTVDLLYADGPKNGGCKPKDVLMINIGGWNVLHVVAES